MRQGLEQFRCPWSQPAGAEVDEVELLFHPDIPRLTVHLRSLRPISAVGTATERQKWSPEVHDGVTQVVMVQWTTSTPSRSVIVMSTGTSHPSVNAAKSTGSDSVATACRPVVALAR